MVLTDANGTCVQTYEYSVYGHVAASSLRSRATAEDGSDPNHPNPFMFTSRQLDIETGLYYYRARYYNPWIGRFLQTDPIGYGYGYCGNNPLGWADPSGLIPVCLYDPDDKTFGSCFTEAADDFAFRYAMTCAQDVIDVLEMLHNEGQEITDIYIYDHGYYGGQWFGDEYLGMAYGKWYNKDKLDKLLEAIDEFTGLACITHFRGCYAGDRKAKLLEYCAKRSNRPTTGCTSMVYWSRIERGKCNTIDLPDYSMPGDLWKAFPNGSTALVWWYNRVEPRIIYKKVKFPIPHVPFMPWRPEWEGLFWQWLEIPIGVCWDTVYNKQPQPY